MNFDRQRAAESKRAHRRELAALPAAEKLRKLDALRTRAQIQRGSRRSPKLEPVTLSADKPSDSSTSGQTSVRRKRGRATTSRFGGRATATGVQYEVDIAAFIGVKMLCGSRCSVWSDISGADIAAITLQAPEPTDDIVVNLRGLEGAVFISAKHRSSSIALTRGSRTFTDTIDAFVRQYLKLSPTARSDSRLMWAIPSSANTVTLRSLATGLETHRRDAGDDSFPDFIKRRSVGEGKAMSLFVSEVQRQWRKIAKKPATETDLRAFLRTIYIECYDFGAGQHLERQAEADLCSHIVADPANAGRVWRMLIGLFADANRRGVRVTSASLRRDLAKAGVVLKAPTDYVAEIQRLRELAAFNLDRLKQHTILCFGSAPTVKVHIPRTEELDALLAGAQASHLLVTGEPGCGKSGLLHSLVERLHADNVPVVLLLAEEVFAPEWRDTTSLPSFHHNLDELLANWPNDRPGFLITDALDAIRDVDVQKKLRRLLRSIQQGESGWTVIASVREFDLKYGRELRDAFPGCGVPDHASNDFPQVAHFNLTGLSEQQLDDLARSRSEIQPFIERARANSSSAGVYRSPFYLRLAADLLRNGVSAARLADWTSPAVLLRSFWSVRIKEDTGGTEREAVLRLICRRMVESRRLTISLKELSLSANETASVNNLRGRGIFHAPALRHGVTVGEDEIRFTHHLLHDYAIAKSLIPETPDAFTEFAVGEPLLPIFYRQSFLFALEEIWDANQSRESYWATALQLEGITNLHGITRILAPLLAARRVERLSDLQPLVDATGSALDEDSPGLRAIRHLASGLQDAEAAVIRTGQQAWTEFSEQLATLLPKNRLLEPPITDILARLNAIGGAVNAHTCSALNAAGRMLIAHHVPKDVATSWRFAAHVGIESVCRTFNANSAESERSLLSLLTPERLRHFPHDDLFELARGINYLPPEGDGVVSRLFEAAFSSEPEPGEWQQFGSRILPMQIQSSDSWNSIHYSLADYYEKRGGENSALMTEAVCIAWNAVIRRRSDKRKREQHIIDTITFRGERCDLVEDYSYIWGRDFEYRGKPNSVAF